MSISEMAVTVLSVLSILTILGRVLFLNPLKSFIKEQTYPIQPNANGGRSLADVARTVDRIEKRLDVHIEQHIEGKV